MTPCKSKNTTIIAFSFDLDVHACLCLGESECFHCIAWCLMLGSHLKIKFSSPVMIRLNNVRSCLGIYSNHWYTSTPVAFCSVVTTLGINFEYTLHIPSSLCKIEWTDAWFIPVWEWRALLLFLGDLWEEAFRCFDQMLIGGGSNAY